MAIPFDSAMRACVPFGQGRKVMYDELRSRARKSWARLISQAHSLSLSSGRTRCVYIVHKIIIIFLTMNEQTSRTCDQKNADTNVRLVARIKWQFGKKEVVLRFYQILIVTKLNLT